MTSFIYMYILYKCSEQNLNCLTKCLWLYVSLYAFRALITHFFPLQSFKSYILHYISVVRRVITGVRHFDDRVVEDGLCVWWCE